MDLLECFGGGFVAFELEGVDVVGGFYEGITAATGGMDFGADVSSQQAER